MAHRLLVRGARQLLTLRGPAGPRRGAATRDLGIIEEGAFLVEDGIITHIGPARRIENLGLARSAEPLDVNGRVVMPGFIDCHTCLIHGAHAFDSPLSAGPSPPSFWPRMRALRNTTAKRLTLQARAAIARMAANGATSLDIHSGYGLDESSELKILRIASALDDEPLPIFRTFHAARCTPPEFSDSPDSYLNFLTTTLLPAIANRRLARAVAITCDAGAFSPAQAYPFVLAARELGFSLSVHAARYANLGAVPFAVDLGARAVAHLESATPLDIATLASSHTIAILLPGAALYGAVPRPAPARALLDSGAAIAIATGCDPVDSPVYSMPAVIALACGLLRLTPAEAITASTINAAHVLGIAAHAGSLESGKQADFLILSTSDYRDLPYSLGANLVVRGRPSHPPLSRPPSSRYNIR